MKKLLALAISLALMISCCSAMALEPVGNYVPAGNPDGVYKIAYVASWLGAEYFSNDFAVLEPILNEAGMEIELFGPADFDTRTEVELSISLFVIGIYEMTAANKL